MTVRWPEGARGTAAARDTVLRPKTGLGYTAALSR
jgi:hypothetical protein